MGRRCRLSPTHTRSALQPPVPCKDMVTGVNVRSGSSGHAGNQPDELLDRTFQRRRPGKAAAETDVVAIVGLGGEHHARRDTDAARSSGAEQLRAVDVAWQLDPPNHPGRWHRDYRAVRE